MWHVYVQKLLLHYVGCGFHCADFHETNGNSVHFYGHVLFQILSKLDEKCRKHGQHFFYVVN